MKPRIPLIFVLITITLSSYTGYASWEILDMPTDRGFTAIWAIDEQTLFVKGHYGLWKTFDGINWVLDTAAGNVTFIYFVDDTLGFIRASTITTDGGKTWERGDTINGLGMEDISFPRAQSLIGYGCRYADVCKTTNGGWNWQILPPLPEVYPDADEDVLPQYICFPSNPDTGYLTVDCWEWISDSEIISRGSYFKTTDGGQTWVLNEEGLWNDDFNPGLVDFPQNPSLGYMAGGGKVYKTTDGGATWDTVLVDTSMSMNDMTFPETDQVGYVIGSNKAYKTTDGGNSWRKLEFGQDTILLFCHFVDNRLGFITGIHNIELCLPYDPGFVMKTTDGLIGIAEEDWVDVQPYLIELSTAPIFNNDLVLHYQTRESGRMRASVFDASGREVQSLDWRNVNYGESSMSFNGALLPSGVYFIRVEFVSARGNENQTLRAVKVR